MYVYYSCESGAAQFGKAQSGAPAASAVGEAPPAVSVGEAE